MPRLFRAIIDFVKRDWQRGQRKRAASKQKHKEKWDARRNRCTRCWYDMRGTDGEVCPECGTPKSRSQSTWTDGRIHLGWCIAIAAAGAVIAVSPLVALVAMGSRSVHNFDLFIGLMGLASGGSPLALLLLCLALLGLSGWRCTRPAHSANRALWIGSVLLIAMIGYGASFKPVLSWTAEQLELDVRDGSCSAEG